jgi:predicted dehydrogenase
MHHAASGSSPVRVALVGCGGIGRVHAQRLVADGRAQIVALFDADRAAAERLRAEYAPQARCGCELPATGADFDAAVICSPTRLHFPQTSTLLSQQIPVLCEKPLATRRDEILELVAMSASGPLLSVSYQRRYDPLYRTLRRLVRSGQYGPVRSVTTHNSERWQQTIAGTWRDDPELNPGGFLGDAGSHKVDMLFFVTGLRVAELFARTDRRTSRVEIVATIDGRFESGAALSMNFIGDAHHWREDFQTHCAAADLLIRETKLWRGQDNRFEPIADLDPGSNPDSAFLDCLLRGLPCDSPADCALPVFDFTQTALRSAASGRSERVPHATDS